MLNLIQACDKVYITLCYGVRDTLVLADKSKLEVVHEWLEYGDIYVFRDQRLFHRDIDGVEKTGNGCCV